MFISRKINPNTEKVEFWKCKWENAAGRKARKVWIKKVCDEKPKMHSSETLMSRVPAICWSYGRTVGNIAVYSPSVLGKFREESGVDAILPCDFKYAGKFRHGKNRWWCSTHQAHWGIKADRESLAQTGKMTCANKQIKMNYVVKPKDLNVSDHYEVGIWCSMPRALSSFPIDKRVPRIHVHVRNKKDGKKVIDQDFPALSIRCDKSLSLFGSLKISRVNITPPAAFEFVQALELNREMACIACSYCHYPHLDLGDFGKKPHRKHFCANCGRDSTWSKTPIISTPLKTLHDAFRDSYKFVEPDRSINLDKHPEYTYNIWASTPAVLWKANRPQEKGIHVHAHKNNKRVIDNTFSEVILNGEKLKRADLIQQMISRTIT